MGSTTAKFVDEKFLQDDQTTRSAWASSDGKRNGVVRPRRVLACSGALSGGRGISIMERMARLYTLGGKTMTHLEHHNGGPTDGTDRKGTLCLLYRDLPLTSHQASRTMRNRYLISEKEQCRLLGTRIGIVGLSTGSVVLEALLRAGIGGIYRLADFDVFETSNSNRMLYGINDAGKTKMELCVERVKSVDPALVVEEFPTGLDASNVTSFVNNCDIIIEECDDIRVKVLVRQAAKLAKAPLLMGTSQNGMIDVERYDCDPFCMPFFRSEPIDIQGASNAKSGDKKQQMLAKLVSSLYDSRPMSTRFQVSVAAMGKTISSFPQLSEEVFLNAATIANASRRILLGDKSIPSGRFAIRFDKLFAPCNRIATEAPKMDPANGLASLPRPPFALDFSMDEDVKKLQFISYWALTAPSVGIIEPWETSIKIVSGKSKPILEVSLSQAAATADNRIHYWHELALGSLLQNADIAADHLGVHLESERVNTDQEATYVMRMTLRAGSKNEKETCDDGTRLFQSMSLRSSVRTTKVWSKTFPKGLESMLASLQVQIVNDEKYTSKIRSAMVKEHGQRLFHHQSRTSSEILPCADKIHPEMLGLGLEEEASLNAVREKPEFLETLIQLGMEKSLLAPVAQYLSQVATFLVLTDPNNLSNVEKGRILERVWLELVHHGVGVRPWGLLDSIESIGVNHAFFVFIPVEPLPVSGAEDGKDGVAMLLPRVDTTKDETAEEFHC